MKMPGMTMSPRPSMAKLSAARPFSSRSCGNTTVETDKNTGQFIWWWMLNAYPVHIKYVAQLHHKMPVSVKGMVNREHMRMCSRYASPRFCRIQTLVTIQEVQVSAIRLKPRDVKPAEHKSPTQPTYTSLKLGTFATVEVITTNNLTISRPPNKSPTPSGISSRPLRPGFPEPTLGPALSFPSVTTTNPLCPSPPVLGIPYPPPLPSPCRYRQRLSCIYYIAMLLALI